MMIARDIPRFLWESTVEHAAYVHNRSHTKALNDTMPYQAWSEKKPDVSNLREFGTPVWIKHQGQHLTKFEPKSRMMILVSYDKGSSSVKYYSAHTKRIRISRNYRFLSLSNQPPPEPEPMEVDIMPVRSLL